MSYVAKVLGKDETVLARARLHWLLWLQAWAALVFLGVFVWGVYFFVKRAIYLVSTEVVVTNFRLIRKTGFFTRHLMDVQLDNVEAANLDQDFWGTLLGYGRITLHGTGDDSLTTPIIAKPAAFLRQVESAIAAADGDARGAASPGRDLQVFESPPPAAWREARVKADSPPVRARLAKRDGVLRTPRGPMRYTKAEHYIISRSADRFIVRRDVFERTYRRRADGRFEKKPDIVYDFTILATPALVPTLEGYERANAGDWVVRGVLGELWPVSPQEAAQLYEPVAPPPPVQENVA